MAAIAAGVLSVGGRTRITQIVDGGNGGFHALDHVGAACCPFIRGHPQVGIHTRPDCRKSLPGTAPRASTSSPSRGKSDGGQMRIQFGKQRFRTPPLLRERVLESHRKRSGQGEADLRE